MADCVACGDYLDPRVGDDVFVYCNTSPSEHEDYNQGDGAHRAHAERLSRELLSERCQKLYDMYPKRMFFCRSNDLQRNERCLKNALGGECGRQDIRDAIRLAETDKTAGLRALEEIKSGLQTASGREQLTRAMAVFSTPPQPRPPSYVSSQPTRSSYSSSKNSGVSTGEMILVIVVAVIIVMLIAWFLLR